MPGSPFMCEVFDIDHVYVNMPPHRAVVGKLYESLLMDTGLYPGQRERKADRSSKTRVRVCIVRYSGHGQCWCWRAGRWSRSQRQTCSGEDRRQRISYFRRAVHADSGPQTSRIRLLRRRTTHRRVPLLNCDITLI